MQMELRKVRVHIPMTVCDNEIPQGGGQDFIKIRTWSEIKMNYELRVAGCEWGGGANEFYDHIDNRIKPDWIRSDPTGHH